MVTLLHLALTTVGDSYIVTCHIIDHYSVLAGSTVTSVVDLFVCFIVNRTQNSSLSFSLSFSLSLYPH